MDVTVRPMRAGDLDGADRIFRLAFGTFLGLPDPLAFAGDADYVRTRFFTDPAAAFAAELDGELIGTNLVATWGTVGFFGPLSVAPTAWNAGVAKHLLAATMDLFAARGVEHAGLFTFPHSPKHVGLYQSFGFWPRFLTAILSRTIEPGPEAPRRDWSAFVVGDRHALAECRALTDELYAGFDAGTEIASVAAQAIGDTILLRDGETLDGFAICHRGAGSEAGSGACYVKLGVARPGRGAGARFERLLDACEQLARERGASELVAGVNTGRREAYQRLLARGFRASMLGVQMTRDGARGFDALEDYVLDDWR